jgi:hypothetical protein
VALDGTALDAPRLYQPRHLATLWLAFYATILFVWRVFFRRTRPHDPLPNRHVLYDYCWMCSGSLWMGAAGALVTQRPVLAQAVCVAVGHDQLLGYLDLVWYGCCGKFPIGVAKYLSWPENQK